VCRSAASASGRTCCERFGGVAVEVDDVDLLRFGNRVLDISVAPVEGVPDGLGVTLARLLLHVAVEHRDVHALGRGVLEDPVALLVVDGEQGYLVQPEAFGGDHVVDHDVVAADVLAAPQPVERADRADVEPLVVVIGRPRDLLALTVDGDPPGDSKPGDARVPSG